MPALAQTSAPSGAPASPTVVAGDGSVDRAVPSSDATSTATGDDANASIDSYPPGYFSQFSPNTALDMIRQVPGFSLRGDEGGERGFGDASSNLLINGRRPSTKTQGAGDLLERIPATSVVRIEILDGASLDIPGLSGQVANVVARAVELSGNWRYAARFEEGTAPQVLDGSVTLSGKRGNLGFALGLNSGQFTRTEDSVEAFFTDDPDRGGLLFEDRREQIALDRRNPSATLNLNLSRDNGHVANLNGRVQRPNNNSLVEEQFSAAGPGGRSGRSEGRNGEDEWEAELSGDYALPMGDGTFKAIGLYRFEDSDIRTIFVTAIDGRDPTRSRFFRDEQETEFIARGEYSWKWGSAHDLQLSGEYAFNALDSTTSFDNNFVPLTVDSVRVEEDRLDARLSDSWTISDRFTLQSAIGAEYSTLGVVAPGEEDRSFFRPKGFVAASYKRDSKHSWRARLERGVGQLNFGTFVSTRGLIDDIQSSGNSEIVPDQFWSASLEWERNDPEFLSARVSPYIRFIQDPIDRILFADGTDGPGNLDSASFYGVEGDATLVMDRLGVDGLRFDLQWQVQDSRIDDPLTGRRRQLNGVVDWLYEVEARYDIPGTQIALRAEAEGFQGTPDTRFEEIRLVRQPKPEVEVGVVFKDLLGMQVAVTLQNILDEPIIRERQRFLTPDRRLGPITSYEQYERFRGRRLSVSFTDTF